ncbi:hypothetical protein E2C01_075430 [Portunus trituberculatus]|uniref:Uncharacterized protein n=1 Tax=Portunus trituberculatus TaxID=210409 RepID=A0A5B7IH15_PORTR|nr:hypothetical protein [Portunus trituberculatus]
MYKWAGCGCVDGRARVSGWREDVGMRSGGSGRGEAGVGGAERGRVGRGSFSLVQQPRATHPTAPRDAAPLYCPCRLPPPVGVSALGGRRGGEGAAHLETRRLTRDTAREIPERVKNEATKPIE